MVAFRIVAVKPLDQTMADIAVEDMDHCHIVATVPWGRMVNMATAVPLGQIVATGSFACLHNSMEDKLEHPKDFVVKEHKVKAVMALKDMVKA